MQVRCILLAFHQLFLHRWHSIILNSTINEKASNRCFRKQNHEDFWSSWFGIRCEDLEKSIRGEDAKSNEVGYKSRIEFLEQKIEKHESEVDELRLSEHRILDLYQQKIKELESKVNIILAKIIGIIYFNYSVFTFRLLHWKKKTNLILLFFQIFIFHKKFWSKSLVIYQPGIFWEMWHESPEISTKLLMIHISWEELNFDLMGFKGTGLSIERKNTSMTL